jgi:hypothetical protein
MRRIGLVFLIALTGCQSSIVPRAPAEASAAIARHVRPATAVSLPAGTYLATVRADSGTIRYYSLTGSTARIAGQVHVQTGDCTIWWEDDASVDRQHGIDFPIACGNRLGFVQVPAGVLGKVAPSRTILTRYPKDSSFIRGAIDLHGNVAIAIDEVDALKAVDHKVLVYGPNASGYAQPSYKVPLRTRGCNLRSVAKGPRNTWAAAEQVAYADDGTLIVSAGPLVTCGPIYIERFLPGSSQYASWFMPIITPGNVEHQQAFFTYGEFVAGPRGELIFGAFFERPNKKDQGSGSNGAVEYSSDASGFEPVPQRTFADSAPDFGGNAFKQSQVVGIDKAGNTYIDLVQGKIVNGTVRGFHQIAVFGPHANGTDKPLRTIRIPLWDLSYGNVIIDVTASP